MPNQVCPLQTVSTNPPAVECWDKECALFNQEDYECCIKTQQRGTIMLVALVQQLIVTLKELKEKEVN